VGKYDSKEKIPKIHMFKRDKTTYTKLDNHSKLESQHNYGRERGTYMTV
jgi:hypothetical protein